MKIFQSFFLDTRKTIINCLSNFQNSGIINFDVDRNKSKSWFQLIDLNSSESKFEEIFFKKIQRRKKLI